MELGLQNFVHIMAHSSYCFCPFCPMPDLLCQKHISSYTKEDWKWRQKRKITNFLVSNPCKNYSFSGSIKFSKIINFVVVCLWHCYSIHSSTNFIIYGSQILRSDVWDHPGSTTQTAEFLPEFHPHQSRTFISADCLGNTFFELSEISDLYTDGSFLWLLKTMAKVREKQETTTTKPSPSMQLPTPES